MAYFNTGNPVEPEGSDDPHDLSDNAKILDVRMTSREHDKWPDRLGVERWTWWGIENVVESMLATSGFYPANGGANDYDVDSPFTILSYNEYVIHDGAAYRLSPEAATVPYETTGNWEEQGDDFIRMDDAILRQDLAAPGGVALVGNASIVFDIVADMVAAEWLQEGMTVSTRGYHASNDGGGNTYDIIAAGTGTDDGGSIIDLGGSGLQAAATFPGGDISPRQFGATSEGAPEIATAVDYVRSANATIDGFPYLIPAARELRIGEFLDSAGPYTSQEIRLQEAINVLMDEARFTGLNLEGRFITANAPLEVADNVSSSFAGRRSIRNGSISTGNQWTGAATDPLIRAYRPDGGRLENFSLSQINLLASGRSSGFLIEGDYHLINLDGVTIRQPTEFGVRDDVDGNGGDLSMMGVKVTRFDATTPFPDRTTIGFDIYSNDCKISQCLAIYCKTGLHLHRGSCLLTNSHFFQGREAGAPSQTIGLYNPAVILPSGQGSKITNCYFDNSPVRIDMNGNSTVNRIQFTDCIFTVSGGQSNYRFIQTANGVEGSASTLKEFAMRGCTIRSFNTDGHPDDFYQHIGTGFIGANTAEYVTIDASNSFWNVTPRLTSQLVKRDLTGQGGYHIDLTSTAPLGLNVFGASGVTFYGSTLATTKPAFQIQRTGGKTMSLQVDNDPGNGSAYFWAHFSASGG